MIIQHMWRTGDIPQELEWSVLVPIPTGTTYTWGIRLLETLWKVVETLIDNRLRASLHFHDILHGSRYGRGTMTAIMELKLGKELASVDNGPLFLVFLDLKKAKNTVDIDCLLQTLEWYGAGPCMCVLLETLWAHQQVVT